MTYTDEYRTVLERIHADNQGIRNLPYFLGTAARWHVRYADDVDRDVRHDLQPMPPVVILGYGIPEQIVYACGVTPHFLLGGSHVSCEWSDSLVPRDSDPVSRSILGYATRLMEQAGQEGADPLLVVPIANDNLRKIAYALKRDGHKVLAVDIPPQGAGILAMRAWESSVSTLLEEVSRHVHRRVTAGNLRWADQLVGAAKAAMVDFQQTLAECEGVLSAEAALLVLNTYYQTDDLPRWTTMLRQLTQELRKRHRTMVPAQDLAPRVLVIGSPILFPQYKVPTLVRDAGLSLLATVDASSTARYASLSQQELRGSRRQLVSRIARRHYALDASGAHVTNDTMEQYVAYLTSHAAVDGVVCHVLKGNIEYDFELARLERLFDERDIPVFRLETDYQEQDVEQLRIRLEAFAEMLEQRAFVAAQTNARRHCA